MSRFPFKTPTPGEIAHLVIDSSGLNVLGEGEWKVKKHGQGKIITGYHRRSIAATARYRVKQLFGGHLSLRDYDGQVAEALAMIYALNKMPLAGMPESVCLA